MAKAVELRELNDDDLVRRLEDTRHDLFKARFELATGQLDNSARLGQLRREVAQISTILWEREIQVSEEGEN